MSAQGCFGLSNNGSMIMRLLIFFIETTPPGPPRGKLMSINKTIFYGVV